MKVGIINRSSVLFRSQAMDFTVCIYNTNGTE